ncbi:MAG: hypothetical protein A2Z21_00540 [Candidatus Fraserbacteria bacterium RBG_16_55_9]|uniref:DUF4160 domain-containing protein n=1 Tax=Fraserbacteria sp. (strain RBG_16_55_9) TaxID=1817864 RepID=A0A1F5UXE7_FRAXR|nr:MAG: hypothetical protein A2Z21_00540 [Candidatus Fraserbacteria bacterium RBG_16_55_9]
MLAFYLPFHFYRQNWGIYLRASGVIYLACVIKGTEKRHGWYSLKRLASNHPPYANLKPGDERFLHLAELFLWEHEAFHFASEIAASRSEFIAKAPVYKTYFSDRCATAHEEALANAQAVTHGMKKQPSAIQKRLYAWMRGQGPGYRNFDQWVSVQTCFEGLSRAVEFMITCIPPSRSSPIIGEFLFRGSRGYSAPTWLLDDATQGAVGILRPLPKAFGLRVLTHSNDHPPPHIHIERPPGRPAARYLWPQLAPYKGDRHLSKTVFKDLQRYIEIYGREIDSQIQRIYSSE